LAINASSVGQGLRFRSILIGAFQFAKLLLGSTRFPTSHDVLFVASPSDITTPSNQGLVSQYLHPLYLACQDLGLSSLVLIRPNLGRVSGKSVYRTAPFPRVRLHKILRTLGRSILVGKFRWKILEQELREVVRSESPTWRDVLKGVSPRLVIGIGLPDDLCKSSREAGIPTIEVQHGFFAEAPPYWRDYFPDFFFSWDISSAEKISKVGLRPIVLGHPFEYQELLGANDKGGSSPLVCCVTLSWGEEGTADRFGSLSPAVLKAARKLQASGVSLLVRIHPVISKFHWLKYSLYVNEIRSLLPRAIIHNPMQVPLLKTVSESDFALTEWSSMAFDFALMGKATIVLNKEWRESISRAVMMCGLPEALILADERLEAIPIGIASRVEARSSSNLKSTISRILNGRKI
jgi:hypothetical protein